MKREGEGERDRDRDRAKADIQRKLPWNENIYVHLLFYERNKTFTLNCSNNALSFRSQVLKLIIMALLLAVGYVPSQDVRVSLTIGTRIT